jgi:putative two-component system response regulator
MAETNYTILVADDDEMIRTLHAEFVRGFGYDVEVACDGFEAMGKVGRDVDLVLTDAHMPNMDGFELARRIRRSASSEELPIVMVTSLEAREDRLKAYESGINDFINKPVDHTELRLRLKWLLELKTAHGLLRRHRDELEVKVAQRTRELQLSLDAERDAKEETRQAHEEAKNAHFDTIIRLARAAEYRDDGTGDHIERIGLYSEVVGAELFRRGHRQLDLALLRYATMMHDVGKIGIPDEILLKPGRLDQRERTEIEKHTVYGAEILGDIGFGGRAEDCEPRTASKVIQMGREVALSHHEKWNGEGYPHGLVAVQIPIEARICSVVDFFDALTWERHYRTPKAFPNAEVVEMIRSESSVSFDPEVVDVFLSVLPKLEVIQKDYRSR